MEHHNFQRRRSDGIPQREDSEQLPQEFIPTYSTQNMQTLNPSPHHLYQCHSTSEQAVNPGIPRALQLPQQTTPVFSSQNIQPLNLSPHHQLQVQPSTVQAVYPWIPSQLPQQTTPVFSSQNIQPLNLSPHHQLQVQPSSEQAVNPGIPSQLTQQTTPVFSSQNIQPLNLSPHHQLQVQPSTVQAVNTGIHPAISLQQYHSSAELPTPNYKTSHQSQPQDRFRTEPHQYHPPQMPTPEVQPSLLQGVDMTSHAQDQSTQPFSRGGSYMIAGQSIQQSYLPSQHQLQQGQPSAQQETGRLHYGNKGSEEMAVSGIDVTRHGVSISPLYQKPANNQTVIEQEAQDKFLKSKGLYRHHIIPDENSIYRAIAESLYGDQSRHDDLRQRAVKYARENLFQSQHASEGDPELYAALDRSTKENILSHVLGVPIHVLMGGGDSRTEFHIHSPGNTDTERPIYISWLSIGHYDAVVSNANPNEIYMKWLEQQICILLQHGKVKEAKTHVQSYHISLQGEQSTSDINDTWEDRNKQQRHDEFIKLLFRTGQDLGKDELDLLKFLCMNLKSMENLKGEIEDIHHAWDLFQKLLDKQLISADDCRLLADLLRQINRVDLAQNISPVEPHNVTDLKEQFLILKADMLILESQLREEKKEKAILEERCKELIEQLEQLEKTCCQWIQAKIQLKHKQDTESTLSKHKNVEDTSVHQKRKVMISKLLEAMETNYIATTPYGKDNIKERRTLMLFAADDETRSYQLASGFTLEVPPYAVQEDSELVVRCDNRNRPQLQDYQCYQSDVLYVKTNATFKHPVYLLRKHLNIDSLTRVQVILMSKNGTDWEEFKKVENQDAKNIRVEVSHFCWVTTISEPYKDTFVVGTKGAKLKSTKDERVTLEVPEDAVHCQQKVTLEVHECSYNTVDTAIPTGGEAFDVSFGSIVYLNRNISGNIQFKKKAVLNIPLPQTIPGVPNADTALCILKDEADNDDWQDITNRDLYEIDDDVLKLKIHSLSGYAVGRYIKDIMPSMRNLLSQITKFKKSGKQMVQILLLQDKAIDTRLECHLIEDVGRSIETIVKSQRYSALKNHRYQSNILMASGDVIKNSVTDNFNLLTKHNMCIYYPYREHHWEALVEPKNGHQRTTMIGLMTFNREQEVLAELTFSTQSERKTPEDIASTTQNRVRYDYSSISNLRCLFLDMGKKLDRNQERDLRFLLRDEEIPRGELQNLENAAEIFENLKEKKGTEDTLKLLKEVFTELKNNTLVTMVEDYQQQTQCV